MKIRKLFKKAAALVLAAVTALSIMPAQAAFAAGDIGTISCNFAYDSNGNAMEDMKREQSITEQLNEENVLEWIGRVNSIRACAEECVEREVIYL